MRTYDIAIIGAGVIGCSLAREFAGRGFTVILLDRAAPGGEASHAAAGMLAPSAEALAPSPLFGFSVRSRNLYPALAAELIAETGIDPHYRCEGTLQLVHDTHELDLLQKALDWQTKHDVSLEKLPALGVASREPHLAIGENAPYAGGLFFPGDHQVDNRLLLSALVASCRIRGVEMGFGEPVLRALHASGRATGVVLGPAGSPRTISAGCVINASGAWAAQINADGLTPLPLRPVKGHMLALRAAPARLRHVIRTEDVYLVPRRDGRVLVGSTMEEAGFDKSVQAGPVAQLLQAALRACPALASAEFLEAWTGLRPATPDGMPIIGPMPDVVNYWTALGHFRNGILLSPITAKTLAEWVTQGEPAEETADSLEAFSPARFL